MNVQHTMSEIRGQENRASSLNELNFHCVMSNPMKHNTQNHTQNSRTHKSSSHNFIEH